MNILLQGVLILSFLLATCHGDLAEILSKTTRYNNDLENKKNLLHARVAEEKYNTVNNINPGNIVILKDNAVYIYDRETGRFVGRSIGAFFLKVLGAFGIGGGLISVDTNSHNVTNKPKITNNFGDIVLGKNINTIE